jgi:hypothetical protein
MSDDGLSELRPFVDAGRHAYRNRAIGCYGAALVVLLIDVAVAGTAFLSSGPIVLVAILALAGAGFHVWYARLDWGRHPVLVALRRSPADVIAAQVLGAHGRAALLDERQVELRTASAALMLTVHRDLVAGLGAALAARCPAIRLGGFPAPE